MSAKGTTLIQRFKNFLTKGAWETSLSEMGGMRRLFVKVTRLFVLVFSRFKTNRCTLHAASLTFFSLMALIPVLALTLAMARAFGGADMAKRQIHKELDSWMAEMESDAKIKTPTEGEVSTVAARKVPAVSAPTAAAAGNEAPAVPEATPKSQAQITHEFSEQMRTIVDQLLTQLDKISFGTLGGIGAVMLLWTVISTLGKVEESFNEVWDVAKARPIQRKMCDYLFTILVLPFLMLAASTVPVAAMVTKIMTKALGRGASGAFATLLSSGLFKTATTLFLSSLTFAFLLGFMPNTKVKIKATLVGGFITALLFGVWLKLCAMLQIGIAKYSALYGGFAILPILLAWIYTSWEIVLLGAELTFAVQNRDSFVFEDNASQASFRSKLLLALALCSEAAREARAENGGPLNARAFSAQCGIPYAFAQNLLDKLVQEKILAKVETDVSDEYLLCRCSGNLKVAEIVRKLIDEGSSPSASGLQNLGPDVLALSQKLDEAIAMTFSQPLAQAN